MRRCSAPGLAILILVRKGYGQLHPRRRPDLATTPKRGTPTMGGAVIIAARAAGVLRHPPDHLTGAVRVGTAGAVPLDGAGRGRLPGRLHQDPASSARSACGARPRSPARSVVAIVFGRPSPCSSLTSGGSLRPSPAISFLRDIEVAAELPLIRGDCIWVMLLIAAASNGVNLTDGLDGLACGACVMIFGAYTLVNIWQYNQSCAYTASAGPKCYEVRDPHDLAVVAAALAGACFGFLWWNAEPPPRSSWATPARCRSAAALAGMAIFTRTELLLVILGGLLVIEVDVGDLAGRLLQADPGRRLFKMSPDPPPLRAAGLGNR